MWAALIRNRLRNYLIQGHPNIVSFEKNLQGVITINIYFLNVITKILNETVSIVPIPDK